MRRSDGMAASPKLGIRAGGDRHAPGESWLSSAPLAHSQGGGSSKNLQLFSVPRTERAQEGTYNGGRAGEAGGRPSQFYERRLRLTRSQGRSEPCHCRPRPTHDQEEWTNCARACVRAWYGTLYIISSFPRPQGCRRRTLRTRKRGLESPPAAGAVSLPRSSARFFFCAARTFSFLISAGAALRNPFLPSFSPAVPSFFYLMALRSATPDFQERGRELLTT